MKDEKDGKDGKGQVTRPMLAAALGVWLRMPAEKAIAHAGAKTAEVMKEAIEAALLARGSEI